MSIGIWFWFEFETDFDFGSLSRLMGVGASVAVILLCVQVCSYWLLVIGYWLPIVECDWRVFCARRVF